MGMLVIVVGRGGGVGFVRLVRDPDPVPVQ